MHIEIEKIIKEEKYNVELKQEVNFEEPKSYLKTVSSFANGYDVGYIIFGIEDVSKEIVGIQNIKKSYEEISNRIKTRIEPSITPIIDIMNIQNKNIILVKVNPGNHTPYYYVNKGSRIAYIRKGDQDVEANGLELNELILRGKNIGWDEQVVDEKSEKFSFTVLKSFFEQEKNYHINNNDLVSFGLIKNKKLTNAAILFSDQNINPSSFISCTRWNGLKKITAKDDIEYKGSILLQIAEALKFIKKHISTGWERNGQLARTIIEEYDLSALREAIINAVAHRNYLHRGTQVEIGIYDDRIEVISFGGLDYGTSIEDVINEPTSTRRNPLICDIFSRLGYMERRGSGIEKILDAYKNDVKKPKFKVNENIFVTIFYSRLYSDANIQKHPKTSENISKNIKEIIYEYIQEKQRTTRKQIIQDLSLTEGQVKHFIKKLIEEGMIEARGKGKNTYYVEK